MTLEALIKEFDASDGRNINLADRNERELLYVTNLFRLVGHVRAIHQTQDTGQKRLAILRLYMLAEKVDAVTMDALQKYGHENPMMAKIIASAEEETGSKFSHGS